MSSLPKKLLQEAIALRFSPFFMQLLDRPLLSCHVNQNPASKSFGRFYEKKLTTRTLSWGGAGTIYGWGHNHRGQLGGVDGAKVCH